MELVFGFFGLLWFAAMISYVSRICAAVEAIAQRR